MLYEWIILPIFAAMKKQLVIALILVLLSGCASTKYVEVPVDRIKIEYRDRTLMDTLIRNDSTIIREKGDTIFLEKYKYLYKTKEVRDTVSITDTITVVQKIEVVKEVNRVHNWQIILMVLGGVAAAFGLYKLVRLVKSWI